MKQQNASTPGRLAPKPPMANQRGKTIANHARDVGRFRFLAALVRQRAALFTVDLLVGAGFFAISLIPGLAIREFFDALAIPNPALSVLLAALAVFVGLKAVNAVMGAAWMAVDTVFRFRVSTQLRAASLAKLLARPGAMPMPCATGDALSRMRDDALEVAETLGKRGLLNVTSSLSFATCAFAVMIAIDVRVTLLAVVPTLGVAVISFLASKQVQRLRALNRQAAGDVASLLREVFAGIEAVKLAGAGARVANRLEHVNRVRQRAAVRDGAFDGILAASSGSVVAIGTGLIMIVAAAAMGSGRFSVGDLALFIYNLKELGIGVGVVGRFLSRYQQVDISRDRLARLLPDGHDGDLLKPPTVALDGLPAEVRRSSVNANPVGDPTAPTGTTPARETAVLPSAPPIRRRGRARAWLAAQQITHAAVTKPPARPGATQTHGSHEPLRTLTVDRLGYHHPDGSPGLCDITFELTAGRVVAIAGRIGSGKTTLLRVLLGLLPRTEGEIRWNDTPLHGEPLTPPRAAYAPQTPRAFSESLKENILLGLPDDDNRLTAAITRAALDTDVRALADGIDTQVGPRGHRLSGGQLHRLAAARMLARDADLHMIDDLSAALDVQTESLLWSRLLDQHGSTTFLVVSNRRTILRRADHIIVMSNGSITEQGSLEEILNSSSDLQQIWQSPTTTGKPGPTRILGCC